MRLRVVVDSNLRSSTNAARPGVLGTFTILLVLIAALATAAVFAGGPHGDANPTLVVCLIVLTAVATHTERVFGDETALNGSIVVVVAGSGIAYSGGPVLIPIVCGLVAGLHWHHLRDLAIRKVIVNVAFTTLSAVAATEVARAFSTTTPGVLAVALCGLATAMAYWLTDNLLVALVLTIVDGRPIGEHARELVRSETEVIPFAVLGFVCGSTLVRDRPLFGLVGIAVLLIATKLVFFHRRNGSRGEAARAVFRVAPLAASAALLAVSDAGTIRGGVTLALLAAIAFTSVTALDRYSSGFALGALVLSTVAALAALPTDGSFEVAIIVGLASSAGFAISRRRMVRNRITLASAAICAAVAAAGVIVAAPFVLSSSVAGAVVVGGLAGLVALLAWHAVLGVTLMLELGRSIGLSATALAAHDLGPTLIAGACGGAAGAFGSRLGPFGPFALVTVVLVAAALIRALLASRRAGPNEAGPPDDELLDVLRSALLDLPASRLPN